MVDQPSYELCLLPADFLLCCFAELLQLTDCKCAQMCYGHACTTSCCWGRCRRCSSCRRATDGCDRSKVVIVVVIIGWTALLLL